MGTTERPTELTGLLSSRLRLCNSVEGRGPRHPGPAGLTALTLGPRQRPFPPGQTELLCVWGIELHPAPLPAPTPPAASGREGYSAQDMRNLSQLSPHRAGQEARSIPHLGNNHSCHCVVGEGEQLKAEWQAPHLACSMCSVSVNSLLVTNKLVI